MLKFQLDTLEGLDDGVKGLYEEKEGKFTLKVDGFPKQTDTSKLEEELELFRKKHTEAEKHRKEQEKLAREAALEAAQKSGDLEALRKSIDAEKAAIREEYSPKLTRYENTIVNLTVGTAAAKFAAEVFGEHAEVMEPHVKARLTHSIDGETATVLVVDPTGKPSAKSLEDLKVEFRADKRFAPFVIGSKASGGGAPNKGGSGQMPSDVRNMTAQEKHDFIKEHGQAKYLELSRKQRQKK